MYQISVDVSIRKSYFGVFCEIFVLILATRQADTRTRGKVRQSDPTGCASKMSKSIVCQELYYIEVYVSLASEICVREICSSLITDTEKNLNSRL